MRNVFVELSHCTLGQDLFTCVWFFRYDDKDHWLFKTLPHQHAEDYHQACIPAADITRGGKKCPLSSLSNYQPVTVRRMCYPGAPTTFQTRLR